MTPIAFIDSHVHLDALILNEYPESVSRMVLNTDSALDLYEDLYCFQQSADFPAALKERLDRQNAIDFFGIPGEEG